MREKLDFYNVEIKYGKIIIQTDSNCSTVSVTDVVAYCAKNASKQIELFLEISQCSSPSNGSFPANTACPPSSHRSHHSQGLKENTIHKTRAARLRLPFLISVFLWGITTCVVQSFCCV